MENTKLIPLDGIFSKGFVSYDNDSKISLSQGTITENMRVYNGSLGNRKGRELLSNVVSLGTKVQGLGYNNNKLLAVIGNKLYISNEALSLYTDLGSINTSSESPTHGPSICNTGKLSIIANGSDLNYYDDRTGLLATSTGYNDIGESWGKELGIPNRNYTSIASNTSGSIIYFATTDGLFKSTDRYSSEPVEIITGSFNKEYASVSCSGDGLIIYLVEKNGGLLKSIDGGVNWTYIVSDATQIWTACACSLNGNYVYLVSSKSTGGSEGTGKLLVSSNGGSTFSTAITNKSLLEVSCSSSGQVVMFGVTLGQIFISKDFGGTFSGIGDLNLKWASMYVSADGTFGIAGVYGGSLYRLSEDFSKIEPRTESRTWTEIAGSDDGLFLIANELGGDIFISFDKGNFWQSTNSENQRWNPACISGDGSIFLVGVDNGQIYKSEKTVDFKPSIVKYINKTLWISGIKNKPHVLYITVPYKIDEKELVTFVRTTELRPSSLVFGSPIVGIEENASTGFVFMKNEIQQYKGMVGLVPVFEKIYSGVGPIHQNVIVPLENSIFFLSSDKKIKTIAYQPGIPNGIVGEISNLQGNSIQKWMNDNLNDDQSDAFGYYIGNENILKFIVKTKAGTYNAIIYSLEEQTFTIDTNAIAHGFVSLNGSYYIGGNSNGKIYKEEKGLNDDGSVINYKRTTKGIDFSNDSIKKIIRELRLGGKKDLNTNLTMNLYIDDELVLSEDINNSCISNNNIGIKVENKLYQFRKVMTRGDLYKKGYIFKLEILSSSLNAQFILDSITTRVGAVGESGNVELFEK